MVWDFCYSIPQSFSGPLVIGNPCAYPWGHGVLRFLIPLSTPRRPEASKPSYPRPKDIGMMQRELRYSLCPICMGQGLLSTSILFIMQLCNISNPRLRGLDRFQVRAVSGSNCADVKSSPVQIGGFGITSKTNE